MPVEGSRRHTVRASYKRLFDISNNKHRHSTRRRWAQFHPASKQIPQIAAPAPTWAAQPQEAQPPVAQSKKPLSPPDNTTGDAPTPTCPTTSALCRPKRMRRHKATYDRARSQKEFVGGVSRRRDRSPFPAVAVAL